MSVTACSRAQARGKQSMGNGASTGLAVAAAQASSEELTATLKDLDPAAKAKLLKALDASPPSEEEKDIAAAKIQSAALAFVTAQE